MIDENLYIDAVSALTEEFQQSLTDKVAAYPGLDPEYAPIVLSGICQMLSIKTIAATADLMEVSPIAVVDEWVDTLYEAFEDEDSEDDEDEDEDDLLTEESFDDFDE